MALARNKIYTSYDDIANIINLDINELISSLKEAKEKGATNIDVFYDNGSYGEDVSCELQPYSFRMEADEEFELRKSMAADVSLAIKTKRRDKEVEEFLRLKKKLGY